MYFIADNNKSETIIVQIMCEKQIKCSYINNKNMIKAYSSLFLFERQEGTHNFSLYMINF